MKMDKIKNQATSLIADEDKKCTEWIQKIKEIEDQQVGVN